MEREPDTRTSCDGNARRAAAGERACAEPPACAAAATRAEPPAWIEADERFDVVIAGCGAGGLYTALNLPSHLRILMLAKTTREECDSMLAQGGICVLHDDGDYDSFFADTMRAGHYENRAESVDVMIRASRGIINDLVEHGVPFARTERGELAYTREAAHSRARICFHEDTTGRAITTCLLRAVEQLPNVEIRERCAMTDILVENGRCVGVVATRQGPQGPQELQGPRDSQGPQGRQDAQNLQNRQKPQAGRAPGSGGGAHRIRAPFTVMATGGIGGLYEHSTNYPHLTGDACRIARAHGVALEHTDYVQFHPTSLYTGRAGRAFLISESARGEGAVLLDAHGNRFTDELAPRDVVTRAILEQMRQEKSAFVRLSFAAIPAEKIRAHFPTIWKTCRDEGFDITREPIPVVPAQHYFMGGVHVDLNSETTLPRLFAVGETSCNGVHGANRLASNSLLETLVFAQRAACKISADASQASADAAGHASPTGASPAGHDASPTGAFSVPADAGAACKISADAGAARANPPKGPTWTTQR